MSGFSPSDAALEGFRLTRERPGTILTWSGVYFLGIMGMALVMTLGIGPKFIAYMKQGGLQSGDPAAFGSLLAQSWPAFVLVLLLAMLLLGVITGGIYRLVLRPEERGFAHLRLGPDEFRLAIVHLLLLAIGTLFIFAIDYLVVGVGQSGAGAFTPILGFLLALGMVWVGGRLSLATPLTFSQRRIDLAAAWRLTRGRFWSLFGMVILAVIFYVMIWILISIIQYAIVTLAGGPAAIMDMSHPAPVAIMAFVVTIVVQLLLPVLQVLMIYAPLAVAYQQLSGDGEPAAVPAEAQRP